MAGYTHAEEHDHSCIQGLQRVMVNDTQLACIQSNNLATKHLYPYTGHYWLTSHTSYMHAVAIATISSYSYIVQYLHA